jgi:hypothetical protein
MIPGRDRAGEGYIVKQILLNYLPSIVAAIAAIISAIAIIAAFLGIRDNQRHNERMQLQQFEEDERVRKRDTLLKTGEELYQLLRKHTKHAPGSWTSEPILVKERFRSGISTDQENERKEAETAAWERIDTLIRIYHPDLLPIHSELLSGRIGLDHLLRSVPNLSAADPEQVSKLRRQFYEAKLGLLHILERRLRSL